MSKRNLLIASLIILVVGCGVLITTTRAAGDLTPKEARRLIARMAGIQLPSDKGGDGKWRVAEIRTGDRRWEDVDMLVKALNAEKTARARAELESIATALESFRRERGSYLESKSAAALIDNLNPHYLSRVIRVDPWHQPYEYEGTLTSFVLRSAGPDEKVNTSDDLIITR